MDHLNNVKEIVEEMMVELKAFLIDFSLDGNKLLVQFDTMKGINVVECKHVNKAVDEYLVENDLDWGVEVGSPGLSEPLRMIQQYQKNIGRELSVNTMDGSNLKGELKAVTKDGILLEWKEKVKDEKTKKKNWQHKTESLSFEESEEFKQIKESKIIISFK
jgi:ribosome maturation factor RimP